MALLEDVVLKETTGDLVLFFDEVDSVLKLPFSDDFFTTIRSIYNARAINPEMERLTVVLIGVAAAASFIKDRTRTPFNIGTTINLSDFDKERTKPFREVLGPGSNELVDRIFYWTSGQPLLVQKLAATAYAWPPDERTAEHLDYEVRNTYLKGKIEQDTHFQSIQNFLLDETMNVRKVLRTYRDVLREKQVREDAQSPVQTRLKLAGVVRVKNGMLTTRNRIYESLFNQEWVDGHLPANTERRLAIGASLALMLVLLSFLVVRPLLFPNLTDTTRIVKYTSDPSVEIQLQVQGARHIYVDGSELSRSPSSGIIGLTIGSLNVGTDNHHTLKLVGFLSSRTREIPIDVTYYPRWEIRQFPDARLDQISPMPILNGTKFSLRDVSSGADEKSFTGHKGNVLKVVMSPDKKRLASISDDGTLKIWDAETGKVLRSFSDFKASPSIDFSDVAFSPDGKSIVGTYNYGSVTQWNVETGLRSQFTPGLLPAFFCVVYSPDGRIIASGSADKTVKLFSVETRKELSTLAGHQGAVRSVAFSPGGRVVASGSDDRTIKIWDLKTGNIINTLEGHDGPVTQIAFVDAATLVSASDDHSIRLWDVVHGKTLLTLNTFEDKLLRAGVSPDGQLIFAESIKGDLKVWDVSGAELQVFTGHKDGIPSVKFSPDNKRFASASWDKTLKLWDVETGQELRTFSGHIRDVYYVDFSPDGKRLASASEDGTLKLWDVETGQELRTFSGHTAQIDGVAFSPDGKRLASASEDGTVKLWDVETGQELRTFSGHTSYVDDVDFSPDGKRLASASEDGTLKLWDVETGQELRTFSGHANSVYGVAFSPDGKRLASASLDKTVKLWDVETGQELRTFSGHEGSVWGVGFSPDGKRIVSGGADRKIKLWWASVE
jgi:WD40 repeat protein